MSDKRILLADDEPNLRKVLTALLSREGYHVTAVSDGDAAAAFLQEGHGVDLLLADLKMPGLDGMSLLKHVQAHLPELPVVIMTAHGTVDVAVEAMKLGAMDFITKPFEQNELKVVIQKALASADCSAHEPRPTPRSPHEMQDTGIIGHSACLQAVFDIIQRVADTPSTILITGESGTGKELVARALHERSSRAGRPFIKVHCAAIPKSLLESELFGYERGAFTGAVTSKPGRFELADKGTLFLDEIGEIPVDMQVKLLRALQESEFERVGGIRTIKVDVRIISATNRDLPKEVESGGFREDLFYRLNVVPVQLPPLRDRIVDIPSLLTHFIDRFNKRLGKNVSGISQEALHLLQRHRWPGNIRELENLVERALLFCDGPTIQVPQLPPELHNMRQIPAPSIPLPSNGETGLKHLVRETTSKLEREYILQALHETGGNVTRAAQVLKISRKGLQNKMKELGLRECQDPERFDP